MPNKGWRSTFTSAKGGDLQPRFRSPAFCLRAEAQKDQGHADLIHEPQGARRAWKTPLSGMREVSLQFISTRGSLEVPNKQSLQLLLPVSLYKASYTC